MILAATILAEMAAGMVAADMAARAEIPFFDVT
jgi:hypothetical protein